MRDGLENQVILEGAAEIYAGTQAMECTGFSKQSNETFQLEDNLYRIISEPVASITDAALGIAALAGSLVADRATPDALVAAINHAHREIHREVVIPAAHRERFLTALEAFAAAEIDDGIHAGDPANDLASTARQIRSESAMVILANRDTVRHMLQNINPSS